MSFHEFTMKSIEFQFGSFLIKLFEYVFNHTHLYLFIHFSQNFAQFSSEQTDCMQSEHWTV